ncbi:hypothetical protein [Timonella senegalensis]|nr:hypothetical protein [Timonella senegalensis]
MSTLEILASGAEAVNPLPISAVSYGIVTFCALVAGLVVTYAFKSVRTRH